MSHRWAGSPQAGRFYSRFAAQFSIAIAEQLQGELRWKGWLSLRLKAPRSKQLPMVGLFLPTGCQGYGTSGGRWAKRHESLRL